MSVLYKYYESLFSIFPILSPHKFSFTNFRPAGTENRPLWESLPMEIQNSNDLDCDANWKVFIKCLLWFA